MPSWTVDCASCACHTPAVSMLAWPAHHIARGPDLKTVQETLGHTDLATTAMNAQLAKRAQRRALQEHAL